MQFLLIRNDDASDVEVVSGTRIEPDKQSLLSRI